MITRAGFPFKILDKTFFTQSREEYFMIIEARNQRSALRRGLHFCFPWKTARLSLVSWSQPIPRHVWVVVFTDRGQVVVRFRKPNHDAIGDQHSYLDRPRLKDLRFWSVQKSARHWREIFSKIDVPKHIFLTKITFLDALQELNSQKFSAFGRRLKNLRFGSKT